LPSPPLAPLSPQKSSPPLHLSSLPVIPGLPNRSPSGLSSLDSRLCFHPTGTYFFRVQGSGYKCWGFRFRVEGLGVQVWSLLDFGSGLGFGVWGLGLGAWRLGLGACGFGIIDKGLGFRDG
jgi:hypothetical protein